jgi:hypothetical protein
MAKSITATTVTEVALQLSPTTKQAMMADLRRHQELAVAIKAAVDEQTRIRESIDQRFADEGEGNALFNGCKVDGWGIKMVCGETTRLNEDTLMKEHGLSGADLDACRETKPSTPYIKITPPKGAK